MNERIVKIVLWIYEIESEPEEGVKSDGVDAKPSDLRMSRVKWR